MAFRDEIAEKHIFPGESGADYNALFGHSQRAGGQFAGTKVTDLTIDQVLDFQNPTGAYGQWVAGKNKGTVSTPAGAYQIVGTTLRAAKKGLGLTGQEKFDEAMQDRLGEWIYNTQGSGAWEGWNGTGGGGGGIPAGPAAPARMAVIARGDVDALLNNPANDDFRDLPVPEYFGDRAQRIAEEQAAVQNDDGRTLIGAAISQEWLANSAFRLADTMQFKDDPAFMGRGYSEELWKEVTEGLPADYQRNLGDATSEAHARALAQQARDLYEADLKLGEYGMLGVGARIGAAILDPVAIGASLFTEGAAAPFVYGAKVTRVGRALRAGAAAGAVNAGIEATLMQSNPTRTWSDVAWAATAGFGMGAALGAFKRTDFDKQIIAQTRSMADDIVLRQLGADLPDPAGQSMGAAVAPGAQLRELTFAEKTLADSAAAPKTAWANARLDVSARLKSSENPIVFRRAILTPQAG